MDGTEQSSIDTISNYSIFEDNFNNDLPLGKSTNSDTNLTDIITKKLDKQSVDSRSSMDISNTNIPKLTEEEYHKFALSLGLTLESMPDSLRPGGFIPENRMPPAIGDDLREIICYDCPLNLKQLVQHYTGNKHKDGYEIVEHKGLFIVL